MQSGHDSGRTIGLFGATTLGVGAIVGGGILALAGVAFATTGPGAILAFALNGVVATLTALTFAELSTAFPESGGSYTFAKKVLSIRAAFGIGWVVWFASIVAGVLYALGFASFTVVAIDQLASAFGVAVPDLTGRAPVAVIAAVATAGYGVAILRRSGGGGVWINIGKVVVFVVLIAGGLWRLLHSPGGTVSAGMQPFLSGGTVGLLQAMGYTFIALQGFDLIAAVGGEVREPRKTLPRAMFLSLGIALLIYLPLLFVIATVGVPAGDSIVALGRSNPETIVALAAEQFFGPIGYWLVVVAAILAMLSALEANLFAASRIARAMARDRTLPRSLGRLDRRGGPVGGIIASTVSMITIELVVPGVAAAGAAASLIFLVSFALVHATSILTRRRISADVDAFRAPFFPLLPLVGGVACSGLAVFQSVAVPAAGAIAAVWLVIGAALFVVSLAKDANITDVSAQARDPSLARLRGRNPLVLVPIANPENAASLVAVANALAPPEVGRVLLLSVVAGVKDWNVAEPPRELQSSQDVLRQAVTASYSSGLKPEALITVAVQPWSEIARVARTHRCESLLLGLGELAEGSETAKHLEALMSDVQSDVVVLRAPVGWRLSQVNRIVLPIGGRGDHDLLRARLLASLRRDGERRVHYLRVLPASASTLRRDAERELARLAEQEVTGSVEVEVAHTDDVAGAVAERTEPGDLIVLGMQSLAQRRRAIGRVALEIARVTPRAGLLLISHRR